MQYNCTCSLNYVATYHQHNRNSKYIGIEMRKMGGSVMLIGRHTDSPPLLTAPR